MTQCPDPLFLKAGLNPGCHAGGVEEGAITLQPCMQLVDRWVLVEERDIATAMVSLLEHDGLRLEGGTQCLQACMAC